MKNKLNINEGEIQRILGLHKRAILKENGQNILNEENTFKIKTETTFEPKGSWSDDDLRIFPGTTFKPSTKIKNALITTKKVSAQFVQAGTFGHTYGRENKAFVVYNCKTKNFYLVGSTDENNKDRKDLKFNKRAIWSSGGNMKSLDNLCLETTVRDEVVVKPKDAGTENPELGNEKGNQELGNQKDTTYQGTSRGNRYTFDFDLVMKAIDDTGKCGVYGSSSSTQGTSGTQGVSGTQGTSGTQGVSGSVTQPKPKVSREDFITWTSD